VRKQPKSKTQDGIAVDRRRFMAAVGAAGAATTVSTGASAATSPPPAPNRRRALQLAAAEAQPPAEETPLTATRTGSDYMVDVLKALNLEYIASNPGSTFRGLHESIINYGGNQQPEFLTCCHEESAIAIAHGYAKAAGRPMAALVHGTVGLQHGSMAIYNAYCDRVPIVVMTGNAVDADKRRPGVEWAHSVQDGASLVRDFTKWDDQPGSLVSFGESLIRAYALAATPPMAPVLIVADTDLQEGPIPDNRSIDVPKPTSVLAPIGDINAVRAAVELLATAENPVIIVDRYARTHAAMDQLVEFAELVQAPVCDLGSRMNFPNTHYLNQTGRMRNLVAAADFILAVEPVDLWGATHRFRDQLFRSWTTGTKPGVKIAAIGMTDFLAKANYQDFQRYEPVDIAIAGDGEATMPFLIEALRRAIPADRKGAYTARGEKLRAIHQALLEQARSDAAYAWNASPISTARLCQEVWGAVRDSDWALVSETTFLGNWPKRLWAMNKPYSHIGGGGGAGVGYGLPAAVGAALAYRDTGRLAVNLQGDGDIMYAPGALWTAAHHRIPLLSVVHNNRAYHQELMHVQRMANRHNRGVDRAHIGTTLTDPNIDYATVARGLGVWSAGPISDPDELGPALKKAVAVVKSGEPALVDVVAQPR
jgi:acetolactate synthase I/II/III large subunit